MSDSYEEGKQWIEDFLHVSCCICNSIDFKIGPSDMGNWLAKCPLCGSLFELIPNGTYQLIKVGKP